MGLLKKLLMGAGALILLLCVVGFLLPKTAHVERSIVIDATPSTVFTILNGFRQFRRWSPWQDADPDMTITFEGPVAGVGAKQTWAGNSAVGTGSQEILESEPYRRILVRLQFGDFGGEFRAPYTLEPEGSGTRLTWGFDADYGGNLIGRYFGLLVDGMVGPDYEKGLAKLKAFAETLPKEDFSALEFSTLDAKAMPFAFVSGRSAVESRALGVALGVAYGKVSGYLSAIGGAPAGPPVAVFHGEQEGLLYFDAGYPLDRTDVAPAGEIRVGYTPAGSAVRAVYHGSYGGLDAAHRQMRAYLAAAGLEQNGPSWEQYMNDPGSTPEAELVTHLYASVK